MIIHKFRSEYDNIKKELLELEKKYPYLKKLNLTKISWAHTFK